MKKNIWVEKMTAFDLMALLMGTIFSRSSVRYDEFKASTIAARLINILQSRGLCKNFYKAGLLLNKKDTCGYAINYSLENDLDNCLNVFCDKYTKDESARFKNAVRLYLTSRLTYRTTFVTMVENKPEFKNAPGANIIYLKRHPLNSVIIPYYRKKGYTVIESLSVSEHLLHYAKPLYQLWKIMMAMSFAKEAKTNISRPKASVWVEYLHNCAEEHIFWRGILDENKFDIVCYFDRDDNIAFDEHAREIEKDRLKWIDLHFDPLVKLAGIGAAEIMDMARSLISCPSGLPFWLRAFRFEFRMWYLMYRPVFSRFKVKVLIQHQGSAWIQEPQLAALEASGGIEVGFHRSSYLYHKFAHWSIPQHVYFVWGKVIHEYIRKRGDGCRYVLPSGLCVLPPQGRAISTGLKKDLKFIMAIFDSSAAYNIYQDEDSLSEFYLRIFSLIEDNAEWGGIVKSKFRTMKQIGRLPRGNHIIRKMESLIAQKRLFNMDAPNSPLTASSMAHLSVCFSVNSAGIIAGAYGFRAIHWDCSGFLYHPIYQDKGQKIFFNTMEDLEKAIIAAGSGDLSIGDFSAWRPVFNHFTDDKASSRIGQFMQDFMHDADVTGDIDLSLGNAVKQYCLANGIEERFFSREDFWKTEKVHDSGGVR